MDGQESLAFYLAEHGFDIWLANSRGNRNSKSHKYLESAVDEDYWDFSFYEMGKYD